MCQNCAIELWIYNNSFFSLFQHDLSNTPDKLYEAAADCICASLYVCFDVGNFEPLALVLQHNVNQLLPVFVTVIETENSLRYR